MIDKTINSFTENINQKLKNPFLGTFIIVWTIRNWEFIYSLFYFDSKLSLDNRILKIKTYFTNYGFAEILTTIGFTFSLLVSTYILINLSKLIVGFFDKMVTPKVYKFTDKSSIVLKSVYNETLKRIELLENKIQSERELRLKVQNENEQLENRIKELITPRNASINTGGAKDSKLNISKKTKLLSAKLIKERQVKLFEETVSDILNEIPIIKILPHITEFTNLGLIKPGVQKTNDGYKFTLTESGKDIHEHFLLEKLK